MNGMRVMAPLAAVLLLSGVSGAALAALSCPFADGNGSATGACIAGQGSWQTSLQARDWSGNGVGVDAYYDPFLNLTWLADVDWARTSGFDTDGLMTWSRANAWVRDLTLFGGSDWRLPTVTPVNGVSFTTTRSNNGSSDRGTAKTGQGWGEHNEMGYMYYVHLGNKGFWVPDDANPSSQVEQSGWGSANTGPFSNLFSDTPFGWYWSDREFGSSEAWSFSFHSGGHLEHNQIRSSRAWAVHSGDLLIPLPGALWLMGSALVGVVAGARRRR